MLVTCDVHVCIRFTEVILKRKYIMILHQIYYIYHALVSLCTYVKLHCVTWSLMKIKK